MSQRFLLTSELKSVSASPRVWHRTKHISQSSSSCSALLFAKRAGGFPGSFHGNTQSLVQLLHTVSACIRI